MHSRTRYPVRLVCPHAHPLATVRRLTLKRIARHPLVLGSEESTSRIQVERAFAKAGLLDRLHVAISASSVPVLLTYLGTGQGIALIAPGPLPMPAPKRGHRHLVQRDATHLFGHEHLMILQRRSRHELPHVRAFRELVQSHFATANGGG